MASRSWQDRAHEVMRSIRALGVEPYARLRSGRGIKKYRENRREFLRQAAGRTSGRIGDAYRA